MTTDPSRQPRDFNGDALLQTCRELRTLLAKPVPPMLRVTAPAVADAVPKVAALVLGIEDLVDRVSMIELANRQLARAGAGRTR